ncbi:unnamed protein product [Amoebophrya sp. A25]|nr:unnamed protein product [Amoebophrya sp. A25]|eukprot:GSA25T00017660001.1
MTLSSAGADKPPRRHVLSLLLAFCRCAPCCKRRHGSEDEAHMDMKRGLRDLEANHPREDRDKGTRKRGSAEGNGPASSTSRRYSSCCDKLCSCCCCRRRPKSASSSDVMTLDEMEKGSLESSIDSSIIREEQRQAEKEAERVRERQADDKLKEPPKRLKNTKWRVGLDYDQRKIIVDHLRAEKMQLEVQETGRGRFKKVKGDASTSEDEDSDDGQPAKKYDLATKKLLRKIDPLTVEQRQWIGDGTTSATRREDVNFRRLPNVTSLAVPVVSCNSIGETGEGDGERDDEHASATTPSSEMKQRNRSREQTPDEVVYEIGQAVNVFEESGGSSTLPQQQLGGRRGVWLDGRITCFGISSTFGGLPAGASSASALSGLRRMNSGAALKRMNSGAGLPGGARGGFEGRHREEPRMAKGSTLTNDAPFAPAVDDLLESRMIEVRIVRNPNRGVSQTGKECEYAVLTVGQASLLMRPYRHSAAAAGGGTRLANTAGSSSGFNKTGLVSLVSGEASPRRTSPFLGGTTRTSTIAGGTTLDGTSTIDVKYIDHEARLGGGREILEELGTAVRARGAGKSPVKAAPLTGGTKILIEMTRRRDGDQHRGHQKQGRRRSSPNTTRTRNDSPSQQVFVRDQHLKVKASRGFYNTWSQQHEIGSLDAASEEMIMLNNSTSMMHMHGHGHGDGFDDLVQQGGAPLQQRRSIDVSYCGGSQREFFNLSGRSDSSTHYLLRADDGHNVVDWQKDTHFSNTSTSSLGYSAFGHIDAAQGGQKRPNRWLSGNFGKRKSGRRRARSSEDLGRTSLSPRFSNQSNQRHKYHAAFEDESRTRRRRRRSRASFLDEDLQRDDEDLRRFSPTRHALSLEHQHSWSQLGASTFELTKTGEGKELLKSNQHQHQSSTSVVNAPGAGGAPGNTTLVGAASCTTSPNFLRMTKGVPPEASPYEYALHVRDISPLKSIHDSPIGPEWPGASRIDLAASRGGGEVALLLEEPRDITDSSFVVTQKDMLERLENSAAFHVAGEPHSRHYAAHGHAGMYRLPSVHETDFRAERDRISNALFSEADMSRLAAAGPPWLGRPGPQNLVGKTSTAEDPPSGSSTSLTSTRRKEEQHHGDHKGEQQEGSSKKVTDQESINRFTDAANNPTTKDVLDAYAEGGHAPFGNSMVSRKQIVQDAKRRSVSAFEEEKERQRQGIRKQIIHHARVGLRAEEEEALKAESDTVQANRLSLLAEPPLQRKLAEVSNAAGSSRGSSRLSFKNTGAEGGAGGASSKNPAGVGSLDLPPEGAGSPGSAAGEPRGPLSAIPEGATTATNITVNRSGSKEAKVSRSGFREAPAEARSPEKTSGIVSPGKVFIHHEDDEVLEDTSPTGRTEHARLLEYMELDKLRSFGRRRACHLLE